MDTGWKDMMKSKRKNIVLIAPPWYFDENRLRTHSYCSRKAPKKPKIFPRCHNLGLAYIAAYLEQEGHSVRIVDALSLGQTTTTEVSLKYQRVYRVGLSYDEIASLVPADTDIIGISSLFTNQATIVSELSSVIKKKYPRIPLVLGGIFPSTLPGKALTEKVDYLIRGEGELPLLQLASGVHPRDIKGLIFRENSKTINNGMASAIANLDEIPFPARHLLPMEKYFNSMKLRSIDILTSRGCPFDCYFCSVHSVHGHKWRARSPENVIAEIEHVVRKYRIEHIEFADDNLTLDPKRAERIFDLMIEKKLCIPWSANNGVRIDTLNRNLLLKMRQSGCQLLALPVESGDPTTLKKMNKKLDLDKVRQVVRICRELGIFTKGYLMVGYPGETEERFRKSIDFAKQLLHEGMDHFAVFVAKPYPSTKLYQQCVNNGLLVTEDIEDIFMYGEYTIIQTKDFTTEDVQWRHQYAVRQLNPSAYYRQKLPFIRVVVGLGRLFIPEKYRVRVKAMLHKSVLTVANLTMNSN